MAASARFSCAVCLVACVAVVGGCSRTHYRTRADRDSYGIVQEKSYSEAWRPPDGYDIQPDPRSRFCDPTPLDDPLLPPPAPQLYGYTLPDLSASPRYRRDGTDRELSPGPEFPLPPGPPHAPAQPADSAAIDPPADSPDRAIRPVSLEDEAGSGNGDEIDVPSLPISKSAWESIPRSCLTRMLEFESLRDEYQLSHGRALLQNLLDPAERLTLEDIIELAQINSRAYQTQKETLYRAALRLTLQRYDFQLKFSPFGNGPSAFYTHSRTLGETVNTLRTPSQYQAERVLATGGDLIARFANSVVLTFNGPQGFAADIGSLLFLELSQTLFQRDIRFEALTQAERNVVFAARDLARFRKTLFVDLATRYYRLIQDYRQVEIDSQNYFALVREFEQRRAEYEVGLFPRFQVDQVEQNALGGRSSLISTCNRLEQNLDNLKISIGLPTETPINLDLSELQELTLSDEVGVATDLVGRVRKRLADARREQTADQAELLEGAIELLLRLSESYQFRSLLGERGLDAKALEILRARLQLDLARLRVQEHYSKLMEDLAQPNAPQIRLLRDRTNLVGSLLLLIEWQIGYGKAAGTEPVVLETTGNSLMELSTRLDKLRNDLDQALVFEQARIGERVGELLTEAETLQTNVEQTVRQTNTALGIAAPDRDDDSLSKTRERIDGLLRTAEASLAETRAGLTEVEIGVDDAMITALLGRLDLMNQRGFLADDWRQIKLAADDLKSILNLSASQAIFTESDINSPLAFTFEDSQTQLSATLDTPLNRRAQRNIFRESLIDYQASRRSLMVFEDAIKLAVRNDLRGLSLSQEQYLLGVTSAALARERSVTTALQLRLGVEGVTARDFLESQTAYAQSLSAVAGRHIDYIINRLQLFLDLELMQLDHNGFWPQLYDEDFQPAPGTQFLDTWELPYGDLPPRVHYSKRVKRMLYITPPWISESE